MRIKISLFPILILQQWKEKEKWRVGEEQHSTWSAHLVRRPISVAGSRTEYFIEPVTLYETNWHNLLRASAITNLLRKFYSIDCEYQTKRVETGYTRT